MANAARQGALGALVVVSDAPEKALAPPRKLLDTTGSPNQRQSEQRAGNSVWVLGVVAVRRRYSESTLGVRVFSSRNISVVHGSESSSSRQANHLRNPSSKSESAFLAWDFHRLRL